MNIPFDRRQLLLSGAALAAGCVGGVVGAGEEPEQGEQVGEPKGGGPHRLRVCGPADRVESRARSGSQQDRKSTRLNSSHT